MNRIEKILNKLMKFKDLYSLDMINKISEYEINKYEESNMYSFPNDFKYFLKYYNWIIIGWIELITFDNNIEITVKNTQLLEKSYEKDLQDYLIPFAYNWRWDYYCINKNDNKVYFWQHDCDNSNFNPDYDCETFSDWLEENIKNSLEVLNS